MGALDNFRQKNPAYANTPDDKLSDGLYNKFYAQKMSRDDFNSKIGFNAAPIAPKQDAASQVPAQPPAPMIPPQQPGFMERVGQDVQKRVGMVEDIKASAGAAPIGETALQAVGGVGAGLVADVAGEVAKSAYGALPESVRQNIEADPITQMGVRMAQKGADVYSKWAQQNPRAAKNVEATVNIASLFPIGAAVKGAKVATGATGGVALKAAEVVAKPIPVVGPALKGVNAPTAEMRRTTATQGLKKLQGDIEVAKQAGEYIASTPANTRTWQAISSLVDESKPSIVKANTESIEAIGRLKELVESGQTDLKSLITERNNLQKIIRKGGDDGATAKKIRQGIDNTIEGSTGSAAKSFSKSIDEYRTMKAYENMADKFNPVLNDPRKIRKRAEDLTGSKSFQYFPSEVQEAVRNAAKGKTSGNIIAAAQRALTRIPMVGEFTGMVVGSVTKPITRAIGKGTVEDVFKAVQKSGKKGKAKELEAQADVEAVSPTEFTDE